MGVNENKKLVSNIVLGIVVFVLTGMALIGTAAKLLVSGTVGEGSAGWIVLAILAVASALGCIFPVLIRCDGETTPILVMLGNLAIVICGGLVIDGAFLSVPGTLIAIVSGGVISCVICMKNTGKNKKRKKRYR